MEEQSQICCAHSMLAETKGAEYSRAEEYNCAAVAGRHGVWTWTILQPTGVGIEILDQRGESKWIRHYGNGLERGRTEANLKPTEM